MSEKTPPFDPFWIAPLRSDDAVRRRLAKKLPKVTQRIVPQPEQPKDGKDGKEGSDLGGCACPSCACPLSDVIATRPTVLGKVWRRRECMHCGARFSTFERVAKTRPIDTGVNEVRKKR